MPKEFAAGAVIVICLLAGVLVSSNASQARESTQGVSIVQEPPPAPGPPATAEAPRAPDLSPVTEIPLKSDDNHEFLADHYAPASAGSGARAPGILLIPDMAQDRKQMARLASKLRDSGYHVLAMDNTGHSRKVRKRIGGVRSVTMFDTDILDILMLDASAAGDAFRHLPNVSRNIGVVGFGLGANMATLYAGENQQISVVGVLFPSYNCKKFDPYEAFGSINVRPALLVDTVKTAESDLGRSWDHISRFRKDLTHLSVVRAPGQSETEVRAAQDDVSSKLLDWLSRTFPVSKN